MPRMSIFLPPGRDVIVLQARMEGDDGIRMACFYHEVRPGQSFWGWSCDELRSLGSGMHDLDPKPGWTPPPRPEACLVPRRRQNPKRRKRAQRDATDHLAEDWGDKPQGQPRAMRRRRH